MTRLPVNASSEAMARRIAVDAAATKVPAGYRMDVGNLVEVERIARPFNRVALEEQNVPASRMSTYVFEATVTKES